MGFSLAGFTNERNICVPLDLCGFDMENFGGGFQLKASWMRNKLDTGENAFVCDWLCLLKRIGEQVGIVGASCCDRWRKLVVAGFAWRFIPTLHYGCYTLTKLISQLPEL